MIDDDDAAAGHELARPLASLRMASSPNTAGEAALLTPCIYSLVTDVARYCF
jgi:hypothetical protein